MSGQVITTGVAKVLAPREVSVGDRLPYAGHLDDVTLQTRDGLLLQTLHLAGFPSETAPDEELNYRKAIRETVRRLSVETGLAHLPSGEGEHVSGIYRQRVTLASGRFAMIDDGLGFSLVPWRSVLEDQVGRQVRGIMHGADIVRAHDVRAIVRVARMTDAIVRGVPPQSEGAGCP